MNISVLIVIFLCSLPSSIAKEYCVDGKKISSGCQCLGSSSCSSSVFDDEDWCKTNSYCPGAKFKDPLFGKSYYWGFCKECEKVYCTTEMGYGTTDADCVCQNNNYKRKTLDCGESFCYRCEPPPPTRYPTSYPTNMPTRYPTRYPTRAPTYSPDCIKGYNSASCRCNDDSECGGTVFESRDWCKTSSYCPGAKFHDPIIGKSYHWGYCGSCFTSPPTNKPTRRATNYPTNWPTNYPTDWPTNYPTDWPTNYPKRTPPPTQSYRSNDYDSSDLNSSGKSSYETGYPCKRRNLISNRSNSLSNLRNLWKMKKTVMYSKTGVKGINDMGCEQSGASIIDWLEDNQMIAIICACVIFVLSVTLYVFRKKKKKSSDEENEKNEEVQEETKTRHLSVELKMRTNPLANPSANKKNINKI